MRLAPFLGALLVLGGLFHGVLPASAHDIRLARISISTQDGRLLVEAKLPPTVDPRAPLPGDGCEALATQAPKATKQAIFAAWQVNCPGAHLTQTLRLPWQLDGALVIRTGPEGATTEQHIRAGANGFSVEIDDTGQSGSFLRYFQIGVHHILSGLDHLALVACLCFLAAGWQLVRLITAFTLGHSVTLALGVLGYVNVPVGPLEALIAFSIAILAREVLLGRRCHGYGLAAVFGLLHGLAFASELAALSPTQIVPALLAFNLGVEAGQLLFVACIVVLIAALSAIQFNRTRIHQSSAALIGCFAIFWSIERAAIILA